MTDQLNEIINLAELTEDDWRLWRSLRLQALAEAPHAFGSTLEQWSGDNDTEERWRGRLRNSALALVSLSGGEPAGMVAATLLAELEAELQSMWVDPKFRGKRVGDQLIGGVLQWAINLGLARVRLYVRAANQPALKLYERHGFLDTGERPGESKEPCEVSMVKILST